MSRSRSDSEVVATATVELDHPVDLLQSLRPLVASRQDPTIRGCTASWRAPRTAALASG